MILISFIYVWNHIQGSMRYFPRILHGSTNMSKLATNPFSLGKTSNSPVVARTSCCSSRVRGLCCAHDPYDITKDKSVILCTLLNRKKKGKGSLSLSSLSLTTLCLSIPSQQRPSGGRTAKLHMTMLNVGLGM